MSEIYGWKKNNSDSFQLSDLWDLLTECTVEQKVQRSSIHSCCDVILLESRFERLIWTTWLKYTVFWEHFFSGKVRINDCSHCYNILRIKAEAFSSGSSKLTGKCSLSNDFVFALLHCALCNGQCALTCVRMQTVCTSFNSC